jgi:muramoyltetrapeptide carboxypeptidase
MNADLNQRIGQLIASSSKTKPPVVAIVAPSGYAQNDDLVQRGIANLQAQGCVVRNFYDPDKKFQRFGATDEARIAQLYAAANDPDVDIVLALRGGYGLTRLLPLLDFKLLASSGKLFVGHSDFTALQMGLLAYGGSSFAGPMLCDDFVRDELSEFTLNSFWHCMFNTAQTISATTEDNPEIDVHGKLWGGNLAMLTHLVGSPYLPSIDSGILFVEDVNEHPYRVERMLLQLSYSGILVQQQAVILGDFSAYKLTEYDNGYDFAQMIAYLRAHLPVPILTGLPFGHTRDKATLVVGAQTRLTSQKNAFELTMHGYPTLATRA